jgi:ribosome-binding protein aMBF1 (putative translation factor)
MVNADPGALVRAARIKSGLSQRALAKRADTAQSVIARIESGRTSPTWDTLKTLLRAAGFDLTARVDPVAVAGDHMMDDVARILRLTPEERLLELSNAARFFAAAERV